jgi:UDP-glucose 4-epimerase
LGTVRVLEAARLNNISRIVYAASSSCYGLAKVPTKETDEVSPQHPYAFTKYLGEVSLFHWAKVYNIQVNSIRIFNAYGTRSKTNGNYGAMFGVFMKQLIEKVPLTVVGDGEQSRDFVYVTDVAKAFLLAATSESHGEIFNVGSGNPRTINEIVSILKTDSIYLPERPGEPKVTWANIRKAKNILGWNPTVTLENGIAKMLAEINYWRTAPLWTEEKIASATSDWFKHLGKADKNDNK